MAANDADAHIRALQLARECIALGARLGTVADVTGLSQATLRTHFYRRDRATNGRRPESSDWVFDGNLCLRAEGAEFANIFTALLERQRCEPADALVAAYRLFVERSAHRSELTFDKAFLLVSDLCGVWKRTEPSLAMHRCPRCLARYIAAVGAPPPITKGCVFCILVQRLPRDPRVQAHFVRRQRFVPSIVAQAEADSETGP
jgi:AraC-like DNA-binding protein